MKKISIINLLLLISLLFGCNSDKIDPNELIGKTKEDVLKIIFDKCPKTYDGLNIGVEYGANHSYQNYYYKSIDDALKDQRLMQSDIWEIGKRKKSGISIFQSVEGVMLFFKDGKVIKFEISKWNMT